jgi:sugar-specific transcriptional regulator TrmB
VFEPIGLTAAEEAVYRHLVGRPQAAVDDVATGTGLKQDEAAGVLDVLHERRLVERSTADPSLYQAIRPDEAFEPLLRERQHEVDLARTAVERLLAEYKSVPRGGSVGDVLEIVEGRQAAERRFDQLYESTRRSNESFVKPPLLVRGVETEHEPFLDSITYKVVYDPAAPRDGEVRRTYPRAQLERLWLTHSGGAAYVVAPPARAPAGR